MPKIAPQENPMSEEILPVYCENECTNVDTGERWPAVDQFSFPNIATGENCIVALCAHCLLLKTVGQDHRGDGPIFGVKE